MALDPETMLQHLQQAAQQHQGAMEALLRPLLDAREQRVLDWLLDRYRDPAQRRWWDGHHALFSTLFACALVQHERLDRLVVSGVILHDVGYGAIEDKAQWDSRDSRILHQQEGAPLAARVLAEIGFLPQEMETVVGMVAVHDNPYLGIPIRGRDRLGVRDCDRVYPTCALSFYREVAATAERWDRPREYLHERMIQFFGQEPPFGAEWAISDECWRRVQARVERPTYHLTAERVARQFERRIIELAAWPGEGFWALLDAHLEEENL